MKSRILIFSTAYLPLIGGAEIAVKEITDRLGSEYEFEMITARIKSSLPNHEQIGNVLVHRMGFGIPKVDKFLLAWGGGLYAKKLHAQKKFSAAWAIMASFGGFACLSFHKKTNVPYLLSLQEGDPLNEIEHKVRFVKNKFKEIFTKAKAIQAISNFLADWAKKMEAISQIRVVPNGVDSTNFSNPGATPEFFNGLPADRKIIFTASRLVEKNGIGDLISALALLPANYYLVVAGTGELLEKLKIETRSLGLEKRVYFLGAISHAALPAYLAASNVFCRPSRSEGLGNAFLEAMSAGLPVVATPVGGIPDFLLDGETGLFCAAANPKDIAEKIKKIVDNLVLAEKLKSNAKKLVQEKYSWNTVAKQIKNVFDTVCAS